MAKPHIDSSPEVARARINAIYKAARNLSIETGGDPAEAVFELICAATLILIEARPRKSTADLIAQAAAPATATVEAWFAEEIKAWRCRHG